MCCTHAGVSCICIIAHARKRFEVSFVFRRPPPQGRIFDRPKKPLYIQFTDEFNLGFADHAA
jgi:hypothetical protein